LDKLGQDGYNWLGVDGVRVGWCGVVCLVGWGMEGMGCSIEYDHREAYNIEFSSNSLSYVCVLSIDGNLAYSQSACAPPTKVAGRRGGGDVKPLANPLSS
jgi:hypothetical protein